RWQVMLFKPDVVGMELTSALVRAARRGVVVQLSFDFANTIHGNIASPRPADAAIQDEAAMNLLLADLKAAGVDVRFNSTTLTYPAESPGTEAARLRDMIAASGCLDANHYDHRKLLIVDGREAIVGGMNVGKEYLFHVPLDTTRTMAEEATLRAEAGLTEAWT